jgi:predicted dehydrogenase
MHRREFIRNGTLATISVASGMQAMGQPVAGGRPLRVAQIGTAHAHAAEKWATLRRFPDMFECVALCEPEAALRKHATSEARYRGAPWVSEAELFARRGIDAVLVETELPDLLHYGERVLRAGWHLHLDKPPGRSLQGFDRLQQLAAQGGRVFQQGYMYRYHPAFRFCFEAAAQGWFGRIFSIHGDIGKAIGAGRRPWLAEHYGGSMMLLGCHLLDLAVGLMGRPGRVTAHRRNTFPDRDSFFDHEVAVLEYPGGLATIRSMLAEVEGEERRQFVVSGENATLEIRPLEPARVRIAFERPPADFTSGYQDVPVAPVDGRYSAQLLDFANLVRGQRAAEPRFDRAHDRLVHEVLLEAAKQAGSE